MGKNYFVNEGNKIGYLATEFGTTGALVEKKIVAGADIVKGQVLEVSDSLTVIPASGNNGNIIGVAMFDAKSGEAVAVDTEGLFLLTASGAITAPAKVSPAADGKVKAAVAMSQSETTPFAVTEGTPVIGIAISDAADGKEVYVKFSI